MNKVDSIKRMVSEYRSGWDESSVGIKPVTVDDILNAVEGLPETYAVDSWRMSVLLETARKYGASTYLGWFVKRWVNSVAKGEQPPGDVEDWLKETQEEE